MSPRAASQVAGMILLLFPVNSLCAEEPRRDMAKSSVQSAANALFRIGEMAEAAADLRKAAEALERFANSPGGLVGRIAKSLATMSSEFDPFGYKTAFRTVGQQAEMIQQQRKIIQALQEREIERLQSQNRKLKKELQKLRQRKESRNGDSK
jgi:hypothetical protein